jgi:hypothetical protein
MAWLAHAVTNWMGDDGFLRNLDVKIVRPNVFGNTTWMRGAITEKFIRDGAACVVAELRGLDQDGGLNTEGRATIVLPTTRG